MDTTHVIDTMLRLMSTDYAIMLSVVIMFQAAYVSWKNIRSLKSPGIFLMTLLCILHVVTYQYGSFRWEIFNYNQFIKIYDVNLWIVIDFIGLLVSAGALYAMDGMLNKLIAAKLLCMPSNEFYGTDAEMEYRLLQDIVYERSFRTNERQTVAVG